MSNVRLLPITILDCPQPIQGVQTPDGLIGATLRSLCAALSLDYASQYQRIRRTPALRETLQLVTLDTPGGPQAVDVIPAWVIPVWLAGLHINRLPEERRALILAFQREAFATIERAFTQPESNAAPPPPPSPSPAPQSVWQVWHTLGNLMEAKDEEMRREFQAGQQELHDEMTVMRYDQQRLALHFAALEARDASPTATISPEQLAHIFRLARQLAARKGLPVLDILAILAEHFRVEDVSVLPAKNWPAVLDWFSSMLEA